MPIHSISKCLSTLITYDMDVGECSLQGFGGPINRQNNKKIHQKYILASKTRKRCNDICFRQDNFFPKSFLMSFYMTHHIYKIAVRRKCFWKHFFLKNTPVQPLAQIQFKGLPKCSSTTSQGAQIPYKLQYGCGIQSERWLITLTMTQKCHLSSPLPQFFKFLLSHPCTGILIITAL